MWTKRDRRLLKRLVEVVEFLVEPATKIWIVKDGKMPTNNSIVAGTSGVFQGVPNGALQAGAVPVWSASDGTVVINPLTSDPTGLTVSVAVPAADANPSFTLSLSVVSANGSTLTNSATVAITPAGPAPATAVAINQLS